MNTQHTPGPWVAQPDPNSIWADDWCIGAQGQIDKVAVCSECDARLLAAAPDLLEALKDVVAFWDSITELDCVNNIHVRARATIAKATGK